MKESPKVPTLPITDLVEQGVYFNIAKNLVRIDKIDNDKKEVNLFNISEQTHLYFIPFDRHGLVKRVR
jgi:hypothetical protein